MTYQDIQDAAPIENLRVQFEAEQEEFTPHLETAFNLIYGRGGVIPYIVLVQQVESLLWKILSGIRARKRAEKKPGWFARRLKDIACFINAGNVLFGKK